MMLWQISVLGEAINGVVSCLTTQCLHWPLAICDALSMSNPDLREISIVICYGWRVLTQNWGSQTVQCVFLHKTDIVTTLYHGEVVVERWKFRYAAIQRIISVSTDSKSTWRKIRKKETFSYFRLQCIFSRIQKCT